MRAWLALTAGAVVYALAVWWSAVRLPVDDVPLHLGASGLADAFGTRAEALAGHIGFGVLMVGLGVASIVLARRGPLRLVNMPYKDYWTAPERRPRFRRMLALDMGVLLGVTVAALGLLPVSTVLALHSEPVGLPPVLMWSAFGLYMLGLLGWCVWLTRHRYRPRES